MHFVHVPLKGDSTDRKVAIGILYGESDGKAGGDAKSLTGLTEFSKGLPSRDKLGATIIANKSHSITPSGFFPLAGGNPDTVT